MKHIKIYENYFDEKNWKDQSAIIFRIDDKFGVGMFNPEKVKDVMANLKPLFDSVKKSGEAKSYLKKVAFKKGHDCLIFNKEGEYKECGLISDLKNNSYRIVYNDRSVGRMIDGFAFALENPYKNMEEFTVIAAPEGVQPYSQSVKQLIGLIKQY
jgi:hypothetical protein